MMRLLLVLALALCATAATKRYDGYKLLEITPSSDSQLEFLANLRENLDVEFFHEPTSVNRPFHVFVSAQVASRLAVQLVKRDIQYTVADNNVQSSIDEEELRLAPRMQSGIYDFGDFNPLVAFEAELGRMVQDCPSALTCEVFSVGTTLEGRPMNVLKISKFGLNRRAHWVDSLTHSREWLSGSTVMLIADRLVRGRDCASQECVDSRRLTDAYDWYVMPVVNPDGYIFSWTDDRMWRKNRRNNAGSLCWGVDMNRNYDAAWGTGGSSSLPCAQDFMGPIAASEPETVAIQNAINTYAAGLDSFMSIHAYGYYWLTSYGNKLAGVCAAPPGYPDIYHVAGVAVNAVASTYGTTWTYGSVCTTIYEASGGTVDYATNAGIKYSFTPELRGTSFVVSTDQIQPSFNEVWNGVVAQVAEIEIVG